MLLGFKILLEVRFSTSPRCLVIELLLNRFCLSFSNPSDCRVCQLTMINFMVDCVFLFFLDPCSDRFNPIEIVHITNWACHFISHLISSWSGIVSSYPWLISSWSGTVRSYTWRAVLIVIPAVRMGPFDGIRVPTTSWRVGSCSICISS